MKITQLDPTLVWAIAAFVVAGVLVISMTLAIALFRIFYKT
jgi:preprotein translocase subunit Sec61beta